MMSLVLRLEGRAESETGAESKHVPRARGARRGSVRGSCRGVRVGDVVCLYTESAGGRPAAGVALSPAAAAALAAL